MKYRYNCEKENAETGETETHNWLDVLGLASLVQSLKDGDDLVIHCVEDTSGI
jgi:hypothetical protein